MPRLSDSMEEGTILRWLKSAGDEVAARRGAGRDRDRQGEHGLRGADRRDSDRDRRRGGRHAADRRGDRAGRARPARQPSRRRRRGEARTARPPRRRQPAEATALRPTAAAPPPRRRARGGRAEPRPRPETDGSRPRPLARRMAREKGLDLAALSGSGPGGRIVKADVERAVGSRRRGGRGACRARRRLPPAEPTAGARERPETAKGDGRTRGADEAPADRRPADGRVEGDRAALLPRGRDRHDAGGRGARAAQGDGRARASAVPSFNDMVVKACAIALREYPARQRRLSRRAVRALLAGQRRRRGRRPGRAGGADDLRRRPQGPAADRRRDARAGAAGARRHDHAARALGRHVHRLQPRDVRDRPTSRP